MRIDVLTLFPEMFESPLASSIVGRAQDNNIVKIVLSNIRDHALNSYGKVDDKPYGGGPGMVLMPEPVVNCCRAVKQQCSDDGPVIILSPVGKRLDQNKARQLSGEKRLILIAGRYEGFDERIAEVLEAEYLSIGDYVLSGGELAAMVLIDSVVRLLDGALGDDSSSDDESFSNYLLEYQQYTRPAEFEGLEVPKVLTSGNHAEIHNWRLKKSIERTKQIRPDLWKKYQDRNNKKDN